MKTFSIYELEKLSGIKMHTIRIWELRYAFLKPSRSKGNTRLYSLADMQLFLNIAFLKDKGYKISKICSLSATEIFKEVCSHNDDESKQAKAINQLYYFMFAMEIESFEEVLDFAIYSWGIDVTIEKLIIPFLEKADVLSYQDNSSEVHFIVTALRKKLILGIEKAAPVLPIQQSALLFLPKGEHYDLVLLYLTYVLKTKGIKVLYLGTNISNENIHQVVHAKNPHFLVTYLSQKYSSKVEDLLQFLHKELPHVTLFVTKSEKNSLYVKSNNYREMNFKEAVSFFGTN